MDKKKLIGTIVGVIMFAILIAGATYAWLTLAADVTNGTYNTGSRNFVIDYTKGTDVTALPILNVASAADVSTSGASSLTVTAKLNSTNSTKGDLSLTLVTTTDAGNLATSGVIKYAVSINGGTPTEPQTVTSANQTLVLSGTSTKTLLLTTTTDENSNEVVEANSLTVYLWLDAETLTSTGQTYAGYIKASAIQRED